MTPYSAEHWRVTESNLSIARNRLACAVAECDRIKREADLSARKIVLAIENGDRAEIKRLMVKQGVEQP